MNASTATSSFAEQQLAKYGWKKGQGLGKNREGVKRAVTVSRRTDNRGIGSDSNQWNSNWWDHLYNKASGSSSTADTPQTTLSEDEDNSNSEARELKAKESLAANERDTLDDYQGLFVRAVSTSVSTVKVTESQQSSNPGGSRVDRTQLVRDSSIHLGSTGISDAELFAACEGRMARKGARAEQNGKLARVLGDGMPRPEVAARIEAALSGRLHELKEANGKKKRKRSDEDTSDKKEKRKSNSKSKSKDKSKNKDKKKSKLKKSSDRQKDTKKRIKS